MCQISIQSIDYYGLKVYPYHCKDQRPYRYPTASVTSTQTYAMANRQTAY